MATVDQKYLVFVTLNLLHKISEVCCSTTRPLSTTETSKEPYHSITPPNNSSTEPQPKFYIVIAVVIPLLAFLVIVSLCISKCRTRERRDRPQTSPTLIYSVTMDASNAAALFNTVTDYFRTSQQQRQDTAAQDRTDKVTNELCIGPPSYEDSMKVSNIPPQSPSEQLRSSHNESPPPPYTELSQSEDTPPYPD